MKRWICLLSAVLFFTPSLLHATGTYIVQGAEINAIANTNGNKENFTIWVKGGSGVCTNKSITFPLTAAGSPEVYARAYATALAAFAAGHKVTVYDYAGSSCNNAAYIKLMK